jgi:flavodoxin
LKILAVCYSKTGNTKKIADAVVEKLGCDLEELQFDMQTKVMQSSVSPADYDRVIVLTPIWGFQLSEPMRQYLKKYRADIKEYSLSNR